MSKKQKYNINDNTVYRARIKVSWHCPGLPGHAKEGVVDPKVPIEVNTKSRGH